MSDSDCASLVSSTASISPNHLPIYIHEMYQYVENFSDLLDLNVKYLTGKIAMTPLYCVPVNKKSYPVIKQLVKINRYGFLTRASEPGLCVYNKPSAGKFLSYEQKNYVDGMIASKYIDGLKSFLLQHKNDVEWTIETKDEIITSTKRRITNLSRNVHSDVELNESTLEDPSIWNTYGTNHWFEYCPSRQTYHIESMLSMAYRHYPKIINIFNTECSYIFVCSKTYGPDISVEDLLLKFFESCDNTNADDN